MDYPAHLDKFCRVENHPAWHQCSQCEAYAPVRYERDELVMICPEHGETRVRRVRLKPYHPFGSSIDPGNYYSFLLEKDYSIEKYIKKEM